MERDRAQYFARVTGNGLLVLAAVLVVVGVYTLWELGADVDDRFGFGTEDGPDFDDYLLFLWGYAMALVTAVGIIGGFGLYFRWLALEQDAKRAEFDMLLDGLGVPVEDEVPTEEAGPDA